MGDELNAVHETLDDWIAAYPADMFPPIENWAEVRAKLGSELLSRVSASNMLHAATMIKKQVSEHIGERDNG